MSKAGERPAQASRVRITGQFHDRRGMVYDLKCDDLRITISIAPSPSGDTNWSAEAVAKQSPDPPSVKGVGASRGQALRVAEDEWRSKGSAAGFPPIDWDAIREAL